MRKTLYFAVLLLTWAAAAQTATGRFDGTWSTTMTCDAKGGTLGYTWHFPSTVVNNTLHGERGAKGQQAYLAIDGKIGNDGKAKLTASGVTAGSQYTHGPFKAEGEDYSYDVKAQFQDTEGKGERSTGLGIVGRPCHYEWTKQTSSAAAVKP
jgi:hypothetical protein